MMEDNLSTTNTSSSKRGRESPDDQQQRDVNANPQLRVGVDEQHKSIATTSAAAPAASAPRRGVLSLKTRVNAATSITATAAASPTAASAPAELPPTIAAEADPTAVATTPRANTNQASSSTPSTAPGAAAAAAVAVKVNVEGKRVLSLGRKAPTAAVATPTPAPQPAEPAVEAAAQLLSDTDDTTANNIQPPRQQQQLPSAVPSSSAADDNSNTNAPAMVPTTRDPTPTRDVASAAAAAAMVGVLPTSGNNTTTTSKPTVTPTAASAPPAAAPPAPNVPGLNCYNYTLSGYGPSSSSAIGRMAFNASFGGGSSSITNNNNSFTGLTSPNSASVSAFTSAANSRTATPIGFTAMRNGGGGGGRNSSISGGNRSLGGVTKHSKLGFAIPPPNPDMGLAPFFHPSSFEDLHAAVANAMASSCVSPGNSQSAFGQMRSGGGGGMDPLGLQLLSGPSPMTGGVVSVSSSPAYGGGANSGLLGPRTPTTEHAGAFASPHQLGGGGGGIGMNSPVPIGTLPPAYVLSSFNTANNPEGGASGGVVSPAAPHNQRSPSMLSPTTTHNGTTTAFIPLPNSLRYPIFVTENRVNNDSGGYFSGAVATGFNSSGGDDHNTHHNNQNNPDDDAHLTDEERAAAKVLRHRQAAEDNERALVAEDLFATALHPFAETYDYDPRDKVGEGTYGAVYIGYTKPTRSHPQRSKVAIKLLKQLPNFEGFPITSVREISVHRYLRSAPESQRSRLMVVDDLRFEYVDPTGTVRSTLTPEMQQELIAMNTRLPPSLQNLPASRRGMVIGEVVVFLVSPFVEHTLSSLRQSLRTHGAGGSATTGNATGASQLANAFQQGFDHHHSHRPASQQPLSPLCLNEEFILFIFIQILEGLHQLHKARIMHRDIKEDNVLVSKTGEVKICDFGLAVPLEGERAKITPSLIVMFYRPPEMLLGAAQYSTAVDMWSAGCLLAQQFLGVPPFITKDGQPTNEFDQLKIITDVLGPLPAKMIELVAPEVRAVIFNHPQRDLIFEKNTFQAPPANPNAPKFTPMTPTERFNRFRTWFDQMYKARRRAHMNNVALDMPTLDTLIAIFNMLSLDPASRPSAERMLRCNEKTCSNRFASNASLVGAADADRTGLSMRSMQTAQSLQQALCWACKAKSRTSYMRDGVAKLPVPKTHMRAKPQNAGAK